MLNQSIVFISGWGVRAHLMKETPYFNEKMILLDLPYLSEVTLESVSCHLLNKIPDQSIIVGWSLGGLVGIQLAYRFPKKVKKLALFSSSPCFEGDADWIGITKTESQKFLNLARKSFAKLFNYFLSLVNYPNTSSDYKNQLVKNAVPFQKYENCLINYLSILFKIDLRKEYSGLKIPLFQLVGEKDVISKIDLTKLVLLNHLTEICLLSRAGHLAFLTHAREVYNRLMYFFNDD